MVVEELSFKTPDVCWEALKGMGFNGSEYHRIIEHERNHYDKAVELGYDPLCCVIISRRDGRPPKLLGAVVDFFGHYPIGQDMIDILLAPDCPSDFDYIAINDYLE